MTRTVCVLLLLCMTSYGGQLTYHVDFQHGNSVEYTHMGYSRIQFSGCQPYGQPGEPLLPSRVVALVIPSGAENVSVSAVAANKRILGISGVIQPAAVPRPFSAMASTPEVIREDQSIYSSNRFWPENRVQNLRTGDKSGFTIVSFLVYPYLYNPVSRELEFSGSVDVSVSWDERAAEAVSPSQAEFAAEQLKGWISNPRDIQFCTPLSRGFDSVDYLVITSSTYTSIFEPFVTFKNGQGISTELVDIASILSGTTGYDDPEKLRNYIIQRHSTDGIKYVLLAGDETVVPVRMITLSCEGSTDTVPVDHYYSDLNGTWDANGDHNYGQTNDSLDLYSDISVGRALFDSVDEATLFVERTTMYESTAPAGDWQTTAMLCGALLFGDYTGATVCDSIAANLSSGWTLNKAYETPRSTDGYTTHIQVINDGANWVHYAGHGSVQGVYWGLPPQDMMSNSIAAGLANGSKAGIHHSIACMPGAFHNGESCAEALWHNANGGAVSVMFNTSYGWGDPPNVGVSEWLCIYLTEEVFQNGNNLIGSAFATSKDRRVPLWNGGYDTELYCILDWHGFHDPTLKPLTSVTGIEGADPESSLSQTVTLEGPFPNPVVSGSSVFFAAGFAGSSGDISIYDVSGRQVWSKAITASGQVCWDTGNNSGGCSIQPGIYFARLQSGSDSAIRKLIITN